MSSIMDKKFLDHYFRFNVDFDGKTTSEIITKQLNNLYKEFSMVVLTSMLNLNLVDSEGKFKGDLKKDIAVSFYYEDPEKQGNNPSCFEEFDKNGEIVFNFPHTLLNGNESLYCIIELIDNEKPDKLSLWPTIPLVQDWLFSPRESLLSLELMNKIEKDLILNGIEPSENTLTIPFFNPETGKPNLCETNQLRFLQYPYGDRLRLEKKHSSITHKLFSINFEIIRQRVLMESFKSKSIFPIDMKKYHKEVSRLYGVD